MKCVRSMRRWINDALSEQCFEEKNKWSEIKVIKAIIMEEFTDWKSKENTFENS